MNDLLEELLENRRSGCPCVLATVAATAGSVPRQPGARMIVRADGSISGTVGGGKYESLVIAEALACLASRKVVLKTWPLREGEQDSFGAICGGEVTVLLEPFAPTHRMFLVGAGHCAAAIARLAAGCGFRVTAADDRPEILSLCSAAHELVPGAGAEEIAARHWTGDDAIVIVSRHYDIDRQALAAALRAGGASYIGMIGSRRKVRRVFDQLIEEGFTGSQLEAVRAPLGLDIGADSPEEIAVSVLAEVLAVLRGRPATPLRHGLK